MEVSFSDPLHLVAILVFLGLAPFLAIMVTSYVKIVVVLSLVRNALGIQQIPPNMVINGLAIILSIYIMNPVIQSTYEVFKAQSIDTSNVESIEAAVAQAKEPIKQFLVKHAGHRERAFFLESAQALWPPERHENLQDDDLMVLVPAFTVTELTEAFQIGFLVYLPFIVTVAQRYKKDAGLGTVISLMIPYALTITVVWIVLFVVWFALGIPLGPGYPVTT